MLSTTGAPAFVGGDFLCPADAREEHLEGGEVLGRRLVQQLRDATALIVLSGISRPVSKRICWYESLSLRSAVSRAEISSLTITAPVMCSLGSRIGMAEF